MLISEILPWLLSSHIPLPIHLSVLSSSKHFNSQVHVYLTVSNMIISYLECCSFLYVVFASALASLVFHLVHNSRVILLSYKTVQGINLLKLSNDLSVLSECKPKPSQGLTNSLTLLELSPVSLLYIILIEINWALCCSFYWDGMSLLQGFSLKY